MARIVELTGAPGVGKTSIYNAIIKNWNKDYNWIPAHRLVPLNSNLRFGSLNYITQKIRKELGKPLTDNSIYEKSAYRFGIENATFVNNCWDLISKNKKNDHLNKDDRFRSASHLNSVFGKYQVLKDSPDKRFALTDEFLSHRILQVTSDKIERNDIEKFVQFLPKPSAIIFLDAPAEILAQRASDRKRSISRHNSLSKSELICLSKNDRDKIELTVDIMSDYGVKIIRVDTTNSVASNVHNIITFLGGLNDF